MAKKRTVISSPILCLFVLPTVILLCGFGTLTLRAQSVTHASSAVRPVSGAFVIRRTRVFDGVHALPNHTDVFVQHGRIEDIGDTLTVPAGTQEVDGTGDTLLPGLIDAHTHMWSDALKQALIFGVTTELDMFSNIKDDNEMRKNEAAGKNLGSADFRTAGTVVTVAKGHGTEYTLKIPVLDNAADAQSFVDARIAEGSDYIKIIYDFGLTIPTLSKEALFAVVAAAHKRHKLAVVHISTQAGARDAIEAGADGLAHTFEDSPPAPDFVEQVKTHGAFVVPTLTVMESVAGTPSGASLGTDPRLDPYINAAAAANLKISFPKYPGSRRNFAYALASVKLLHDAGVPVLAGTDAPNPGTAHGVSIHRELELLVQAGLTPEEALVAATSLPAKAFGLTDRGRIAPGLRADLLLVKGDPTKAIADTRAIVSVWKMGVEDDRGSYRAAIEEQKTTPPSIPTSPATRATESVLAQNASSPSVLPATGGDLLIDGVPIPRDAHVTIPDAIPENLKRFSGAWVGAWAGWYRHILIVENIAPDGNASVIYAVGDHPNFPPQWHRHTAVISGNTLRFGCCTYEITTNGTLNATYVSGPVARMSKVDWGALARSP